ncbi:MAG: response regulator transcription factor [Microthrixaceae bacterium]|nr:response regulator transcription factor [Microthrixaceae bacterium]
MSRILVVEDEESFVDALTVGLEREGFSVDIARNGAEALDKFKANTPDLVLLDMMLPVISGLDVCAEIRRSSDVPIIIVSAKSSELDTVVGLEVGADDYVTKPYRMRELVARIRAALRRRNLDTSGLGPPVPGYVERDVLTVGGLKIDFDSREVFVDGVLVELPRKEFDLLGYLMENAGRVLERSSIINTVWGLDYVGDTKTLDVHIKRLRAKIEIDPSEPSRLVTVRGVGYKLYDPA